MFRFLAAILLFALSDLESWLWQEVLARYGAEAEGVFFLNGSVVGGKR